MGATLIFGNFLRPCSSTRFFFFQGTTPSCQQAALSCARAPLWGTKKTIQIAPGDLMSFWVEVHQTTACIEQKRI